MIKNGEQLIIPMIGALKIYQINPTLVSVRSQQKALAQQQPATLSAVLAGIGNILH